MTAPRIHDYPRAFSMLELLLAMGIISLLALAAFSVTRKVRSKTDLAISVGHQRQIVSALIAYANDHRGELPEMVSLDSPIRPGYTLFWPRVLAYYRYVESPAVFFAPGRNRWRTHTASFDVSIDSTKPWAYPSYGVNSHGAMPRRVEGALSTDHPANLRSVGEEASRLMLVRDVYHPSYTEDDYGWYYWDSRASASAYLPADDGGYGGMIAASFADGSVRVYPIAELRRWVAEASWGSEPEFARKFTRTNRP